jgi:NAD(P)-dependent dehydrogenase (short-subunit alcohol dehydrogenase family)
MRKRIGFEGRVAVVTGAGGGLGREHALLLACRGAQVVVNDLGGLVDGTGASSGPAADVVREIEGQGGVAVPDASDIATPEGGEALTRTAIDAFGRIDIVVNNAGILRDKTFVNMDPSLWEPVIKVHLTGAMYVTRPAWVAHAGTGLRTRDQHGFWLGVVRKLRASELRGGEDGPRRTDEGARPGRRPLQHQRQCDSA